MTKKMLLFLLIGICVSCNSTRFSFDGPAQTGVDFTSGTWLIHDLGVPYDLRNQLTHQVKEDFGKFLGDRLNYAPDQQWLLLPQKEIQPGPSRQVLKNLRLGTGYDYLINIKALETQNEFSALDLTNHRTKTGGKQNQGEVIVEIYDLKNELIIYSQKVIGTVVQSKNGDFSVSRTQSMILMGAYNRIVKDLDKKSVY